MGYEDVSKESLEALGRVIQLCLPDWPCGRLKCKRCRKNHEDAWVNSLDGKDIDEDAIWGIE